MVPSILRIRKRIYTLFINDSHDFLVLTQIMFPFEAMVMSFLCILYPLSAFTMTPFF